MSRIRSLRKFTLPAAITMAAVFLAGTWAVMTASATTAESAVSTLNLPGVSMAANSSYVSDAYFGVLHLNVDDDTVACASIDSQNRVVVTAVSPGETAVSFWYKKGATDDWVSAVLPVTVSGTSSVAQTVMIGAVGLVFPQQTTSMSAGSSYTMDGITLNGTSVNASTLLWISSSDSIVTVDRDTGKIRAVAAGTAKIYAIDPTTNSCAGETVIVS